MKSQLTTEERELMCHALELQLGLRAKQKVYRNRFICEAKHPIWTSLVERGYATSKLYCLSDGDAIFFVSDAGCIALIGMTLEVAERHTLSKYEVRAAYGQSAKGETAK